MKLISSSVPLNISMALQEVLKNAQIQLRQQLTRRRLSRFKTPYILLLAVFSLTHTHRQIYRRGVIESTKLHRDQTISHLTTEIAAKIGLR